MGYLTLEVEIDHGKILPREPGKLPQKGKGFLTVTESSQDSDVAKMTQLEAFRSLQKSLNLDEAKAGAWIETIRDARR